MDRRTMRRRLVISMGYCVAMLAVTCWLSAAGGEDATRSDAKSIPLTIKQNVIQLPDKEIPPGGKIICTVQAEKGELSKVLLRFEAILKYGREAGYNSIARITVNGVTVDDKYFPVNWGDSRTFRLPNIPARKGKTMSLYAAGVKAWVVRYDSDRLLPTKTKMYYIPEMADKYVYMFPVGRLLKAGKNYIEIENVSKKDKLQLFSCKEFGTMKIDNARASRITGGSVEITWDHSSRSYEIDYRLKGKTKWQTIPNVLAWENPYNVIMLKPETDYEFRVRGLSLPVADIRGKVATPAPIKSAIVRTRTAKSGYKTFAGLRLYPTHRIPASARTYPCIESHNGFLWVTASDLRLLKMDPVTKKILWTRKERLASKPKGYGYLGVPDTEIFGGKLYVTYNVQGAGATPRSLQYLISYDFLTDTVSTPILIPPTDPKHVVLFAGIRAWRGKLWILQRDEWGKYRSLLALRTFEDGKFGKPIVYENVPTPSCWGTSISTFNDKIVLMFSDLVSALEQAKDQETLYYTLFDGKTFSKARVIHDVGRSRYAKGVQLGNRFVCVYKCSAPYYKEFGYQYHDLALSVFVPGTDAKVQTTMYVDDRKYNSSPDMAVHNGRALVVYNKIEHLYGDSGNPAVHYGIFIGEVVPEGDAGKK